MKDRDPLRANLLSKHKYNMKFIHDRDSDKLAEFFNTKMGVIYATIQARQLTYENALRMNRQYILPRLNKLPNAIKGHEVAVYLIGVLGFDTSDIPTLQGDIPFTPEHKLDYAVTKLLSSEGRLSNATFSQKIRLRLEAIMIENKECVKMIEYKVKRILGLELITG